MNKVVYVNAFFKPIGKDITKKVPTGEKQVGLFGKEKDIIKEVTEWEQTGYSNRWIDGKRLSNDIATAVSQLNDEGYEVVTVVPVISGDYNYSYRQGGSSGYGYGYGYSYTEGVTILAKKIV